MTINFNTTFPSIIARNIVKKEGERSENRVVAPNHLEGTIDISVDEIKELCSEIKGGIAGLPGMVKEYKTMFKDIVDDCNGELGESMIALSKLSYKLHRENRRQRTEDCYDDEKFSEDLRLDRDIHMQTLRNKRREAGLDWEGKDVKANAAEEQPVNE